LAATKPVYRCDQKGQIVLTDRPCDAPPAVVPLVLTFSADDKVSGSSPQNGCKALGVLSPGVTPRLFMLDVSLSACAFAKFNQRYSGTLIATFPEQMTQLALQAYTLPIPGIPFRHLDVGGTLRR
jgi:hypothetical protein